MAFEPDNPSLRDGGVRKGEFREMARDIVWKDRDSKRAGRTVDTGGAIARAMEVAYRLGLAHGTSPLDTAPAGLSDAHPQAAPAMAWRTIPPRPRAIFERILSFKWIVLLAPNASPWTKQPDRWACYWDWGEQRPAGERYELADTFSRTTLAPIVRLGLMQEKEVSGRTLLEPTALAYATWAAAIAAGDVRELK